MIPKKLYKISLSILLSTTLVLRGSNHYFNILHNLPILVSGTDASMIDLSRVRMLR